MDADVEPEEGAIEVLVEIHKKHPGLISVWPYQRFERFYEHLNLVFNLIIVYASNMLGFPSKRPKGAFGPVILTSRRDYMKTGGHAAIKDSVLEDIKLGRLYIKNGIKVMNFLGNGIIKFRMYPEGFRQLSEGFSKNISSGALTGGILSFLLALIWISGFYYSFTSFRTPLWWSIMIYFLFSLIVYLLSKPLGDYRWYDAFLYPLHFTFFAAVFFHSLYKTLVLKKVTWRGREIKIR